MATAWHSPTEERSPLPPPADTSRVPATAAMGSLESYLYGNNVVDSGTPSSECHGRPGQGAQPWKVCEQQANLH